MKAIVLRKRPYSEIDLIVDFYVESFGLCTGFASGGLRSKKRFPHQFHIAGVYNLNWQNQEAKDRLLRIQSCELIHFFPEVGANIEKLSYWSMVQEWLLQSESFEIQFEVVESLLQELTGGLASEAFHHFFIQQMKENGWAPQYEGCASCHQKLEGPIRFSIFQGGLIHGTCGPGIDVGLDTYQFLKACVDHDAFADIKALARPGISSGLNMISIPFLEHHIGKHLKSYEFFKSLKLEHQKYSPNLATTQREQRL